MNRRAPSGAVQEDMCGSTWPSTKRICSIVVLWRLRRDWDGARYGMCIYVHDRIICQVSTGPGAMILTDDALLLLNRYPDLRCRDM